MMVKLDSLTNEVPVMIDYKVSLLIIINRQL